jgi:hypothetical protein
VVEMLDSSRRASDGQTLLVEIRSSCQRVVTKQRMREGAQTSWSLMYLVEFPLA